MRRINPIEWTIACMRRDGVARKLPRVYDSLAAVLIDWDYGARGIWWVLTRQEKEAPAPGGRWSGAAPPDDHERIRPGGNRLTSEPLSRRRVLPGIVE